MLVFKRSVEVAMESAIQLITGTLPIPPNILEGKQLGSNGVLAAPNWQGFTFFEFIDPGRIKIIKRFRMKNQMGVEDKYDTLQLIRKVDYYFREECILEITVRGVRYKGRKGSNEAAAIWKVSDINYAESYSANPGLGEKKLVHYKTFERAFNWNI